MRKKLIFGIILGFLVAFVIGATYTVPGSTQEPWELLRGEASEDPNSAIGSVSITRSTAGDFANKPATAKQIRTIDGTASPSVTIGLAACAGSAANKTFTTDIWVWRKINGMAQKICTIDWTTGTQQVVKYPHTGAAATNKFWADTATVTSYWFAGKTDSADEGGDNGVAVVQIVLYGEEWVYAEVKNADGETGNEAGDVSIYWFRCN